MSRPLRIEFEGAVYHVTSRGDRREPIFVDDDDRGRLLQIVGHAMDRFDAQVLAYCLMGNHYHFVVQTRKANLSALMRHVNGVYTQDFNRRHGKVGHLLQGRFKAVLVDRDAYLLEVCRYVELNPVRAGLIERVEDWAWSSYAAHVGLAAAPPWLDTSALHGCLLGRTPQDAAERRRAATRHWWPPDATCACGATRCASRSSSATRRSSRGCRRGPSRCDASRRRYLVRSDAWLLIWTGSCVSHTRATRRCAGRTSKAG